jgi:RecA-family ATPase
MTNATPPKAANDNRRTEYNAEELLKTEFPPLKWAVEGFIPEGLTVLAGRPKLGKTWLAYSTAIAIATGGKVLGVECEQGDVLQYSLEDNFRRAKSRILNLLPAHLGIKRPSLDRLTIRTEAPTMDRGFMREVRDWHSRVENPRLLIVDTHAKIKEQRKGNQDPYLADYSAIVPLQEFSGEHGLTTILVTHLRKMGAESGDPIDQISGTVGITGAADMIMVLDRNEKGSSLYGRGRDAPEYEVAMQFDSGHWNVLGDAEEVARSRQRTSILDALQERGEAMSPADIAKATGIKSGSVSHLLAKMAKDGLVQKYGYGAWYPVKRAA